MSLEEFQQTQLRSRVYNELAHSGVDPSDIIFMGIYGSRLYGTETKDSDTDVKVVFFPKLNDLLMLSGKRNINLKLDDGNLEIEAFSIHEFIKLAKSGQTIALNLLNINHQNTIYSSEYWRDLVKIKKGFVTKSMKAFLGYAQGQMRKYSLKGDTLRDLIKFISILRQNDLSMKLKDAYSGEISNIRYWNTDNGHRIVKIFDKQLHDTVTVEYAINMVQTMIDRYGERATKSMEAGGKCLKAMVHSFRISEELIELYRTGEIVYPMKKSDVFREIRDGALSFLQVSEMIEENFILIEELAKKSSYPTNVDENFVNEFLFGMLKKFYLE